MAREIPDSHPLLRLFRGITEFTFEAELGIADPNLVGYVAELLARFVPSQDLWRLRDGNGRRIEDVTHMVAEAEAAGDSGRRRECHRHVGDFALFWTGVFPEALPRLQLRGADRLVNVQEQGKRSYYLASTLESDDEDGPIFRRLSAQFEMCAYGLTMIRKEWERLDDGQDNARRLIVA